MKELKATLETAGFENVRTYIQSGNIILDSSKDPEAGIRSLINTKFGFAPTVLILQKKELDSAVLNNPYQEHEGKFVHFYFCKEIPKLNTEKVESVISASENYTLIGKVFYIHAPDGVARSKLIANIENCLGVSATGRNFNTANKLREILLTR